MKLLKDLRKKYKIEKKELMKTFGYEDRQSYDALENIHKRYTIEQILLAFELFKKHTGCGAAEFIDKLKKEVK